MTNDDLNHSREEGPPVTAYRRRMAKLDKILCAILEPIPKPIKKFFHGVFTAAAVIVMLILTAMVISHFRPNSALNLSWRDFKVSTAAATRSAEEAAKAEQAAKEALSRITTVEHKIEAQRDTIDAVASSAAEARRSSLAAAKTTDEAKAVLEQLKQDAEFYNLVEKARVGFADAYDSLSNVPPGSPHFAEAYNARLAILDDYAGFETVTWKYPRLPDLSQIPGSEEMTNLFKETVSLETITKLFPRIPLDKQRETIPFVRDEKRFSDAEKLQFFHDRALNDPNLRIRASAGKAFLTMVGIRDVNPLSSLLIEENWRTNALRQQLPKTPAPNH